MVSWVTPCHQESTTMTNAWYTSSSRFWVVIKQFILCSIIHLWYCALNDDITPMSMGWNILVWGASTSMSNKSILSCNLEMAISYKEVWLRFWIRQKTNKHFGKTLNVILISSRCLILILSRQSYDYLKLF